MKESRENRQKKGRDIQKHGRRRLTVITAGTAAAVLVFSCIAGVFLHAGRTSGIPGPAEESGSGSPDISVEFGAVLAEENQAVHTMLNKPAAGADPDDKRSVFKIIEVIPHEACSVFPYLVEWGSPEMYDKNVTIGYEGLLTLTTGWDVHMFNEEKEKAGQSNPYTIEREAIRQSILKNYEMPMSAASSPNGKWYRKTQDDQDGMLTEDGYFEYVGEGKGLYYLSSSWITDDPDGKGIRYETRAEARKGTETPKGELYVADAAYYLAKDDQAIARPKFNGRPVVSQTGYHYDLSFTQGSGGSYVADMDSIKASANPEYSYHLVIPDAETAGWVAGFSYAAGGNYVVDSVVPDAMGQYVRISDSSKPDGYMQAGLDAGYFRLASPEDGSAQRYRLELKQAAGGCYYANKPAVWSGLAAESYFFQYAGKSKGFYDVAFRYSTEATLKHYEETLVQVKPENGRYALTATSKTEHGNPIYKEKDGTSYPADYTNMVKNISFHDLVNTRKTDAVYNLNDDNYAGVGINLGGADTDLPSERGGFVFVPVSDKKDREETRLSSLPQNTVGNNSNTDGYYRVGDRIYVTGQERRYRYYCRDGFYNNEWFKLLCYSNHPLNPSKPYTEMINGVGYDYDKTPGENLADENTRALLEAFNQNMRIEIVQITPEKLTPEDIKSAQLIYISNQEGIQKLSGKWNQISDAREKAGLAPLAECTWTDKCSSYKDLSEEALMTIYDECIWKRDRALIASINIINSGDYARTNLEKLGYFMNFFHEAKNWAEFMPEQYPDIANEDFSRVKSNADVEVCLTRCEIEPHTYRTHYNWGYDSADAQTHSNWKKDYFQVFSKRDGDTIQADYKYDDYLGWNIGEVQDGETKLTMDYWLAGFLQDIKNSIKIWEILQNRQEDNSTLAIEVVNAQMTAGATAELAVYADEFDNDTFRVLYKVHLLGGVTKPELNVSCEWEDGTVLAENRNASYATEYEVSTRAGFTADGSEGGSLNPALVKKKLIIKAKNANGKEAQAEVWVIVREGFDLN